MVDVVIARPIHHAMPAGMRRGQSRTRQLQPVLVCCAQPHSVLTVFCCLLLDFLCSRSLFPLFFSALFSMLLFRNRFFLSFLGEGRFIFLNLLLKLLPNDPLHFFLRLSNTS